MSWTLYGIPNCDTVKKARNWLESNNIDYSFHDYKKSGIDGHTLKGWCNKLGYGKLLNQRGTTWRKLDDAARADINEAKAIVLMQEHTSLIKRPVLDTGTTLMCGFSPDEWETLL